MFLFLFSDNKNKKIYSTAGNFFSCKYMPQKPKPLNISVSFCFKSIQMTATITTRVEEKLLLEIDQLSKEKHMDRATLLRNLIAEGLSIERKNKVLSMYKERRISLAKAAEMLDIDLWQMIDMIKEENLHLDYSEEELTEDLKGLK